MGGAADTTGTVPRGEPPRDPKVEPGAANAGSVAPGLCLEFRVLELEL